MRIDSAAVEAATGNIFSAYVGMSRKIDQYFPYAYSAGIRGGAEVGIGEILTSTVEAEEAVDKLIEMEQGYLADFMTGVGVDVASIADMDFENEAEAEEAIDILLSKRDYRVDKYSKALYRVAFLGFMSELALHEPILLKRGIAIVATFSAIDDADLIETSCDGCAGAVGGNPYDISSCPHPGDFECGVNCRHGVLITKKERDSEDL